MYVGYEVHKAFSFGANSSSLQPVHFQGNMKNSVYFSSFPFQYSVTYKRELVHFIGIDRIGREERKDTRRAL